MTRTALPIMTAGARGQGGKGSMMDEIGSLMASNLVTIVGAVWYVSTRVSSIKHSLASMQLEMQEIKDDLRQSREGRAKLHDKLQDLSERITIQEVKSKSTRIGLGKVTQ
jgi:septal ring factor EnvC (AmiA/AmiB activator)